MALEIHDSCHSLSEKDVEQTETKLGVSLPVDYRTFLLRHNGGWPEPSTFPLENNPSDDHARVHYFLCIEEEDPYNLIDWAEDFQGRVPPGLLPIAVDPGGNLVCVSTSGGKSGTVYFWDHEEEAGEGETPGYDNVYYVAENFEDFLNMLTSTADDEAAQRE